MNKELPGKPLHRRAACIDRLSLDENGRIGTVKITLEGVAQKRIR
jgi:hypothetical protein